VVAPQYVATQKVGSYTFDFFSFNITDPNFQYQAATQLVTSYHAEHPNDVLVGLVHGGVEYSLLASPQQEAFDRSLIDAGTNLVIGAHPHVVEPVEAYHHGLIFYSLGNFIFDQYFSPDVQQGLGVDLTIDDGQIDAKLVPFQSAASQPALMASSTVSAWLAALASRSDPVLGPEIKAGEIIINK
jgi:Bacterial capsule synthesis protein PGA_cap